MAKALFSTDTDEEAFINSAEIFAVNEKIRIINSDGVDVAFSKFNINGEFVTQCKTEEDVELHYSFDYDCVNENAIAEKAAEGIKAAKDRSVAKRCLESGNYDVILSEFRIHLRQIFRLLGGHKRSGRRNRRRKA